MAALIAIAQADIKRILAYSTVSQLGLMMVSLGVGGVAAGMMHLLAHGFFKALLFLGAGSVIHGCHHEQDIRKMGGLRRLMPVTFSTYAIGMMALSGVPLFFSGGWTKEEILHVTAHWPASRLPYYFLLVGVVLTALYMTRQIIYVFFGDRRAGSQHAHESPRVMTMPLIVLASCAILFSIVLTPAWPWLHDYLTDEPVHFEFARLIQPTLFLSLILVGAGVALGIWMYRKAGDARSTASRRYRSARIRAAPIVSVPRKQNVDRRTLCSHGHRVQLDERASVRLDGPSFLGSPGARSRRDRSTLRNFYGKC